MGQVMLGLSGQSLALRGDSVTALTWAVTERPRGEIVTNAAMVWTLLCVAAEIHVKEVIHIPGDDNVNCDRLSRRGSEPTLTLKQEAAKIGLEGVEVVEMDDSGVVTKILKLCDPKISLKSEQEFIAFWMRARSAIGDFLEAYPIGHTSHKYRDSDNAEGDLTGHIPTPHIYTPFSLNSS
jgi:hypothetical protein